MNIRKPVDYSAMYVGLDHLMAAGLPQMELYCGIGRAISERPEKGAAVIAAEYLQANYPDVSGFSPRNTRRMREFYRTYENSPALLDEAMKIGWTQNVVILEAELTLEEKAWYIRAAHSFGWSLRPRSQTAPTNLFSSTPRRNRAILKARQPLWRREILQKMLEQTKGVEPKKPRSRSKRVTA